MSGYTRKGNQWYLNGQLVKAGDQGYDRYGNLNQMQADGTWKTLQRATKEGIEARKNNLFTPEQYKKWKPKDAETMGGKIIKRFGDLTGLYHTGKNKSDLLGMSAYMIPGVGNALSAGDAYNDFRKGNYSSALMNTVFALPFIGNVGRYLKTGLQVAKLGRAARAVGKGVNGLNRIRPVANKALNVKMMVDLPQAAKGLYDTYQMSKQQKEQYADTINQVNIARKKYRLSEDQIKKYLGNTYDIVSLFGKRDNTFLGNMGTTWDLMSQDN